MHILITLQLTFFTTFIAVTISNLNTSAEYPNSLKYLIIKEKDISKSSSFYKYLEDSGDETEQIWKAYLEKNGTVDDDWSPFGSNESDSDESNRPRRQMTQKEQRQSAVMAEMMQKLNEEGGDEDGLNEPYWKSGEWVFLRTGTPTVTAASPTTPAKAATTTNPMQVYRGCDRSCSYYFKTYGKVCGHRYNTHTWRNEYENFTNICDIELRNCENPILRPNWHPLHRGACNELLEFPIWVNASEKYLQRKKKWDPYEYKVKTGS